MKKNKDMQEKKPFRQLAICGTAETLKDAPFDDEDVEIWATATCLGHPPLKRADALFEIHPRDRWEKRIDAINQSGAEVWMQRAYKEIPKSKRYPIEGIVDMFPRRYFTNTISYMLAKAIYDNVYSVIGIYGVHFATNMEYAYERPNLEYYIGRAENNGVVVEIPDEADIMHCSWMYGYEHSGALIKAKSKRNEYRAEAAKLESQIEQGAAALNQYKGAAEAMDYMMRILRV